MLAAVTVPHSLQISRPFCSSCSGSRRHTSADFESRRTRPSCEASSDSCATRRRSGDFSLTITTGGSEPTRRAGSDNVANVTVTAARLCSWDPQTRTGRLLATVVTVGAGHGVAHKGDLPPLRRPGTANVLATTGQVELAVSDRIRHIHVDVSSLLGGKAIRRPSGNHSGAWLSANGPTLRGSGCDLGGRTCEH